MSRGADIEILKMDVGGKVIGGVIILTDSLWFVAVNAREERLTANGN